MASNAKATDTSNIDENIENAVSESEAAEVVIDRMVLVERAHVLRQRIERTAQRGPGAAIGAVRMRGGDCIGSGLVHARMDGEGRGIDRVVALHHVAVVVAADQVRHRHLAEMHAEGINPEGVGKLRVARGDMAGHAFIEAKLGKQPERRGQALLAVLLQGAGRDKREAGHLHQGPAPGQRVGGRRRQRAGPQPEKRLSARG